MTFQQNVAKGWLLRITARLKQQKQHMAPEAYLSALLDVWAAKIQLEGR